MPHKAEVRRIIEAAEHGTISGVKAYTGANTHTGAETHTGDEVFSGSPTGIIVSKTITFTEDASSTSHTGTVEIPAGSTLHNIQFVNTVLWTGGTAVINIGDDDDANGWFAALNCKATDLLVGEVLDISNAENWGGKQGVYLVAGTGRKGRVTSGVDSGVYYGAASEVIGVMTVGTPATTAGRSLMTVTYSVGTVTAATSA
jgi:hypothetical protein